MFKWLKNLLKNQNRYLDFAVRDWSFDLYNRFDCHPYHFANNLLREWVRAVWEDLQMAEVGVVAAASVARAVAANDLVFAVLTLHHLKALHMLDYH